MTDQFLAEIRLFAGTFAPVQWALCDGQLLPITQNSALFSLLGTNYGGDGRTTFALPDLRGVAPMQQGQGPGLSMRVLGETGGEPAVSLLNTELPAHTHVPNAVVGGGDTGSPAGATFAEARYGKGAQDLYSTSPPNTTMHPLAVGPSGGSQPHDNMPPYLCLTFIIALQGIYPARP
jgi:microcystin-dependent protein